MKRRRRTSSSALLFVVARRPTALRARSAGLLLLLMLVLSQRRMAVLGRLMVFAIDRVSIDGGAIAGQDEFGLFFVIVGLRVDVTVYFVLQISIASL
jgi:hypothetical protein